MLFLSVPAPDALTILLQHPSAHLSRLSLERYSKNAIQVDFTEGQTFRSVCNTFRACGIPVLGCKNLSATRSILYLSEMPSQKSLPASVNALRVPATRKQLANVSRINQSLCDHITALSPQKPQPTRFYLSKKNTSRI
uniref:Uncharacterized protein n=1 Tax=Percolomonas cosmopolitus TaxID=63605 RepID=A0A7S1KNL8_9EUKA|mmetsp:Transcript_3059/g.11768  ORF Transcript_3059/g.11768 Transcript_3059/m.11768 type:complete len:138 (+) Transcript_3059:174-587(+)